LEGDPLLAGSHVPEFDRFVLAPRGQGFAVRTEGHGLDPVSRRKRGMVPAAMPLDGGGVRAAGNVPELDSPVTPPPRGHRLAVRAEGHGRDRVGMPFEGGSVLTFGYVPELDRLVITR